MKNQIVNIGEVSLLALKKNDDYDGTAYLSSYVENCKCQLTIGRPFCGSMEIS